MEKEFIPYEQALAMKELGFDEPCLIKDTEQGEDCAIYYEHENGRPTYSQAFRWFRENYSFVGTVLGDGFNGELKGYYYSITEDGWINYYESIDNGAWYDTYEEAELECLKKLINIING